MFISFLESGIIENFFSGSSYVQRERFLVLALGTHMRADLDQVRGDRTEYQIFRVIRKWEPSLRERFRRPSREKREKPSIFARIWPSARRALGDRAREALTAIHHAQHCQPLLPTNQEASVLSVQCILSQSTCDL